MSPFLIEDTQLRKRKNKNIYDQGRQIYCILFFWSNSLSKRERVDTKLCKRKVKEKTKKNKTPPFSSVKIISGCAAYKYNKLEKQRVISIK